MNNPHHQQQKRNPPEQQRRKEYQEKTENQRMTCVGGEGHGRLVYQYTWPIKNCATWFNIPVPSACCSLVAFKPLKPERELEPGSD